MPDTVVRARKRETQKRAEQRTRAARNGAILLPGSFATAVCVAYGTHAVSWFRSSRPVPHSRGRSRETDGRKHKEVGTTRGRTVRAARFPDKQQRQVLHPNVARARHVLGPRRDPQRSSQLFAPLAESTLIVCCFSALSTQCVSVYVRVLRLRAPAYSLACLPACLCTRKTSMHARSIGLVWFLGLLVVWEPERADTLNGRDPLVSDSPAASHHALAKRTSGMVQNTAESRELPQSFHMLHTQALPEEISFGESTESSTASRCAQAVCNYLWPMLRWRGTAEFLCLWSMEWHIHNIAFANRKQ